VLAVLVFHAGVAAGAGWLPGGFLGVDVFFVLSGYLISSLLLREFSRRGRIDLGRFYLGRARRLLPALLLVLLGTSVLALTVARDAAERFRADALASLGYVTNWWYVGHSQSYFESVGRAPLLQHLWSLAVEEQFYLLWPLVLWVVLHRFGRRGLGVVAVGGALASTVLMAALAVAHDLPASGDASRLYFGTDTHGAALLVGAALATVWRPDAFTLSVPRSVGRVLSGALLGSSAALLACFVRLDPSSGFLYRGGFLLVALLSAVVIATASHPATVASGMLSGRVLRWTGERSYGIYLWHWPIFLVTRPGIDVPYSGATALALSFGLTFALAELSYRFVELPVRRGAVAHAWRAAREQGRGALVRRVAVPGVALTASLALLGAALAQVPDVGADSYLGGVTAVGAEPLVPLTGARAAAALLPTVPSLLAKLSTDVGVPPSLSRPARSTRRVTAPRLVPVNVGPATAVGDSVLLGARAGVGRAVPGVVVDAVVSRQPDGIFARVLARRAVGALAPVVIVSAGTNGLVTRPELSGLLGSLRDRRRVVLLTVHVPKVWMDETNGNIYAMARLYPNVRVADWSSASIGHRDWFVADGTHLTPVGINAYAAVIAGALR
jgi:peptidoglycan/LPS O-acetylase OafA/YrhL